MNTLRRPPPAEQYAYGHKFMFTAMPRKAKPLQSKKEACIFSQLKTDRGAKHLRSTQASSLNSKTAPAKNTQQQSVGLYVFKSPLLD